MTCLWIVMYWGVVNVGTGGLFSGLEVSGKNHCGMGQRCRVKPGLRDF